MNGKNKPKHSTPTAPKKIDDAEKTKLMAENAVKIAQWAAQVLVAAEKLRVKTKVVDTFVPGNLERTVLSTLPTVPLKIRKKMRLGEIHFTAAEVSTMLMAIAEALTEAQPSQQVGLLMTVKTLMDTLQKWITETGEAKIGKEPKTTTLYQFKITLLESKPPIWRRIQIQDCTLDDLHEHIQTAMGWTNSHLHQFVIDGDYYGDPQLLEDMGDIEIKNSTTTLLSEILPAKGKRFRFTYEYDFGDGWLHEVLFEGSPEPVKGKKYPLCLEGERACPPEDVGGVWGYADFLEAITDPKHDEHDNMLEWVGGKFDSENFSPTEATKVMKKGLPDWRSG